MIAKTSSLVPGLDAQLLPGDVLLDSPRIEDLVDELKRIGKLTHANVLQSMIWLRSLNEITHTELLHRIRGQKGVFAAIALCHRLVSGDAAAQDMKDLDKRVTATFAKLSDQWESLSLKYDHEGVAAEWPYPPGGLITYESWIWHRTNLTSPAFPKLGSSTLEALVTLHDDLRIASKSRPDRVDRLLLILALAYVLLCGVGLRARAICRPSAWCSNNKVGTCSVFRIGQLMIERMKVCPWAAFDAVRRATLAAVPKWG